MWSREEFHAEIAPAAIGMIHLAALPGSPAWAGDLATVGRLALRDARALQEGGLTAVMVENYHDVPFYPGAVPPETVAAMTHLIGAVRGAFPELKIGVNVLRNDVASALAIAVACGAQFVRVNVHVGAAATDQGPIVGQAWQTLRKRRELGADRPDSYVAILADVRVKHARPAVERPLAEEAQDLRLRGLADGIIVTGAATGSGADPAEVALVREALPDCPVLVGSGVDAATVARFLPAADGCIIGSSLKEPDADGGPARVSATKTRRFVSAMQAAGQR
jgi:membrane complex biogenesis BtpA family protein